MTFVLPSLEENRQQCANDIETWLPGTDARTRRSTAGVLAFAQAGAVQGLHGHIDYRYRNMLPDELADAEGVERWARAFKLWYRAPVASAGQAQVTGSSGSTLPAGTQLQYGQGVLYTTRADLVLAGSTGQVWADAQASGANGNLPAGARLTLLSPVLGIQSSLTVAAGGFTGGAEQETLDGLRVRVNRRMSDPPQGGSLKDYATWALDSHQDITRAWVTEHELGSGSVVVRIACDNLADPIPSAAVLADATSYIAERRPAGRRSVSVLAPLALPVAYQVRAVPNTASVKAAIEAELRDLHRRASAPGVVFLLSQVREAVSIANGESDNSVTAPAADVAPGTGQMPTFGSITWL